MNWCWLIYDHIPPELKVPYYMRQQIRRELRKELKPLADKRTAIRFFAILPMLIVLAVISFRFYDHLQTLNVPIYVQLIPTFVFILICQFCSAVIYRTLCEKKTYGLLRRYGYQVCGECGYWLKGLDDTTNNCPECGTKREPLPESALEEHAAQE